MGVEKLKQNLKLKAEFRMAEINRQHKMFHGRKEEIKFFGRRTNSLFFF
jgi:23S rRNA U2552 (ribose-2'-O)-methylase RlmE/FtsJ